MRYLILAIGMLSASLSLSAADVTRYELDVKDFIELKVTDGINVDYVCNPDSAGKAVFETIPELASEIIFVPNNEKLEIQLATDVEGHKKNLPTIRVYSTFLSKVENSGDSTVRVLSVAPGAKFKARLIGNGAITVRNIEAMQVDASIDTGHGSITIYGKTQGASLKTTGKGNIQADNLIATNVKCSLFGTGSIGCSAQESLTIYGTGSGTVYYRGSPTIKKRALGVKVVPIE